MIRHISTALILMVIFVSCKPEISVTDIAWTDLDIFQPFSDDYDFDSFADEDDSYLDNDINDGSTDIDESDKDIEIIPDSDTQTEKSCNNASCSGGFCFENGGFPECFCPFGSHDEFPDCVENYSNSKCKNVTCSDHGTCFDAGGLLTDPICQCDDGYITIALTCLKNLSGDPCDYIDCGPNSECTLSLSLLECGCKDGFIPDESGWGCVKDVPDPCESFDCGKFGKCEVVDNKAACKCYDGYFYNGKTCIKESEKTCSDIKCSDHGTCAVYDGDFYCKCDKGYYPSGLECLKDESVQCVNDFDCYYICGFFNGKCVSSKCQCS